MTLEMQIDKILKNHAKYVNGFVNVNEWHSSGGWQYLSPSDKAVSEEEMQKLIATHRTKSVNKIMKLKAS